MGEDLGKFLSFNYEGIQDCQLLIFLGQLDFESYGEGSYTYSFGIPFGDDNGNIHSYCTICYSWHLLIQDLFLVT